MRGEGGSGDLSDDDGGDEEYEARASGLSGGGRKGAKERRAQGHCPGGGRGGGGGGQRGRRGRGLGVRGEQRQLRGCSSADSLHREYKNIEWPGIHSEWEQTRSRYAYEDTRYAERGDHSRGRGGRRGGTGTGRRVDGESRGIRGRGAGRPGRPEGRGRRGSRRAEEENQNWVRGRSGNGTRQGSLSAATGGGQRPKDFWYAEKDFWYAEQDFWYAEQDHAARFAYYGDRDSYAQGSFHERPRGRRGLDRGRNPGRGRESNWCANETSEREDRFLLENRGQDSWSRRIGAIRKKQFPLDQIMAITDTTQMTLRLTSHLAVFEDFINIERQPPQVSMNVLKILNQVSTCEIHSNNVHKIFQKVCSSRFIDSHLGLVIRELQNPDTPEGKVVEMVEMIHDFLSIVCQEHPSYASKAYLPLSAITSQPKITGILSNTKPSLEDDLKKLLTEVDDCMNMLHDAVHTKEKHRLRRGVKEDDEIPPEDFVKLPIFPEDRDMEWSEKPFLRANKEEGAYRDVSHYLDVQFRLMREDYIRPLRKGIREYRFSVSKGDRPSKMSDMRLYYGVRIVGVVCKESLEHRLQFDVSGLGKVQWQSSKRFTRGALLCLTRDNFATRYFATVSDRDKKELEQGIVQVTFEYGLEDIIASSSSDVFTMAETTGAFFEAYRHVLEGLQDFGASPRDFPLARYLVHCNTQVKPPAYLLVTPMPKMDLRSILDEERRGNVEGVTDASAVSVINPKTWPPLEETALNGPQLEAVRTALSKELAIIQGPPGTGKTYVGLKVAKVLLENRDIWTDPKHPRPVLVVCYTNHALDQFLEGILHFCPSGIVRVGSRSKSTCLDDFNLKFIRRRERSSHTTNLSIVNSIKDCDRELLELKGKVEEVSSALEASARCIVKEEVLEEYMLPEHFKELTSLCGYGEGKKKRSMMADWLSFGLLETEGEDDDNGEVKEKDIDPSAIHTLSHDVRQKLYRLWLDRTRHCLTYEINSAMHARKNPTKKMQLLDSSRWKILPDDVLQHVMDRGLYFAIKSKMAPPKRQDQCEQYCVRSWLGLSGSPQEGPDVQKILYPEPETREKEDEEDDSESSEEAEEVNSQRMLDDDDDPLGDGHVNFTAEAAMCQMSAIPVPGKTTETGKAGGNGNSGDQGQRGQSEWNVSRQQRNKQQRKLFHLLATSKPMRGEEAASVKNLWSPQFAVEDRVCLYLHWLRAYQDALRASMKTEANKYAQECKRRQELKFGEDLDILQKATVVGMTTTGAARYRRVLAAVACPIVIIEEAAEVLEAHVVTTLHKKCQHLILIGDHQQLRPSPTVYELCRHYKLDLSLFERLINNRLPHSVLAVQHRMRPEIARLVRHVYPHLEDHESTERRRHIRGLKHDVFLFHHQMAESAHGETTSKSNQHEAELCVRLCRYLLQQGYPPDTITILTAYTGQVLLLRGIINKDKEFYTDVRVTAVDNYQGEENDVIILSLVRSNQEGSVGFLRTDNRVCVALSRARKGFYAFGNFRLLSQKSKLWEKVVETAKENGQFGESLILQCQNHPNTEVNVSEPKDFDLAPEGGCQLPCGTRLRLCGHVCRLLCHGYDKNHEQYKCLKKCERQICKEKHPCPKKCYELCDKCEFPVEKTVPMCGHQATMECSKDPHTWRCATPCQGTLPCGHQCSGKCGECRERPGHVKQCPEQVEKIWPCGHLVKSACYVPPGLLPCRHPCDVKLDCGHPCAGSCGQCWGGRVHVACNAKCGKRREGCRHKCSHTCGTACLPCDEWCREKCVHGACPSLCWAPCTPCMEPCPWRCPHKECRSRCCEPCKPCQKPCRRKLRCSHRCRGLCGEACLCFVCERKMFVPLSIEGVVAEEESKKVVRNTRLFKIPHCGHIFRLDVLDVYVDRKLRSLPLGVQPSCPACPGKLILARDTWRFCRLLTKRHADQQRTKIKVLERTSVAESTVWKISTSSRLIRSCDDQKLPSAPASGKEWDVNLVFVLTSRIKLAYVIQEISDVLYLRPDLMEELQILQKILLPMKTMTQQQRRQMIAETKRLVLRYLVLEVRDLLSTSQERYRPYLQQKVEKMAREKKTSTTPSEQPSKVQALIDFGRTLEDCAQDELQEAGVVKIVNDCAGMGFRFEKVKRTSDQLLSILNSHSYQHLCDIMPPASAQSARMRLSNDSRQSQVYASSGTTTNVFAKASLAANRQQGLPGHRE